LSETPSAPAAASSSDFRLAGSRRVRRAALGSSAGAAGTAPSASTKTTLGSAGEPQLEVTGRKLLVRLEDGVAERLEEPQRGRARCGIGEAGADLGRPLVAESGGGGQVLLQRVDVW